LEKKRAEQVLPGRREEEGIKGSGERWPKQYIHMNKCKTIFKKSL
jgi:hypothetical protein